MAVAYQRAPGLTLSGYTSREREVDDWPELCPLA
jgi:hypothetical protein